MYSQLFPFNLLSLRPDLFIALQAASSTPNGSNSTPNGSSTTPNGSNSTGEGVNSTEEGSNSTDADTNDNHVLDPEEEEEIDDDEPVTKPTGRALYFSFTKK